MSQPRERLINQLSSSIFSPQQVTQELSFRPKKRLTRDGSVDSFTHGIKRVDTPTNSMLKPQDHSLQDIFGDFPSDFYRKGDHGLYHSFSKDRLKPRSKDPVKKVPKPLLNQNKGKLEIKISQIPDKSAGKPVERDYIDEKPRAITPNLLPRPNEAKVDLLKIKGLSPYDNELSIKEMCKGAHIISISPDIDNVTGNCIGTASIQIRSNPNTSALDTLKHNFLSKGLDVFYITLSKGKRNNYHCNKRDFLDSHLEQEEKRLSCNTMSSVERKRAILATSDDLFGNSPGTGKWQTPKVTTPTKEIKKTTENLRQWDSMRTLHTKSPIAVSKPILSGYSRPTISSRKKEITYKD